ncbi:TIGR03885 family FMN-dependent LLM class oxidoreductase [Paracoccus benzoatiresistens]|uniref:TIGR03885 family FMN-dependent LLM class oxidoreductase n=1 Tax=Paracoccus benzoatiresistens TaxID=2997341 RepID=A0ABT4J0H1_9RHOB|nr:TIGR03885 family FMN-dependent LLM class oxidoreductase [Paracoccus sp. EF6]MCZ0960618.1 TIGR03885 family FMN-dependent LLM class oxidoreductase [Paracoccus sp. EF6]
MTRIGYHCSHEQYAPRALRDLARLAEEAGFAAIKCSDHIQPWSERQGHSGHAWVWLGAAMQATTVPFGNIAAPGYRYHPAVMAQAAATLGQMFPGRFWLALGTGEALNEAMTGQPWPDKPERNARLKECFDVMHALLRGETVTHRGRVTAVEARLWSLPDTPPPLFGAAATAETARFLGGWAEGLLTLGGDPANVAKVIDAFREGGGAGKPVHIQHTISWAATHDEAMASALDQWAPVAIGGEINWDIRRPSDFDLLGQFVDKDQIGRSVSVSADPGKHRADLQAFAELGADVVFVHNVGRNQEEFIDMAARELVG